ncbi:hypothetical protein CKA32_004654 [Geitlerinema sp. FC II]|nr:hypothetical protein CKA32_004654 [Geitlerinema sp. FC II]
MRLAEFERTRDLKDFRYFQPLFIFLLQPFLLFGERYRRIFNLKAVAILALRRSILR